MSRIYYNILLIQLSFSAGFIFYNVSITYFIYQLTQSTFLASLTTFLNLIAKMISKFFIQKFTQKYTIKQILLINTSAQMIFLLLMLVFMNLKVLLIIYILTTLISFFNGMFYPLKNTLIKNVFDENEVAKVIAGISSFDQAIMFSGYIVAGWILAMTNVVFVMSFTLVCFIIALINITMIPIDKKDLIELQHRTTTSIVEGYRLLFSFPVLRQLTFIEFIEALIGIIWIGAIQLAFIQEFLNEDTSWWGYFNAAYFAGTMIGAIVIYKFKKLSTLNLYTIIICQIVYVITVIIFGTIKIPVISVLLIFIMGLVFQTKDILQETLIISKIPKEHITLLTAFKSTIIEFGYLLSIILIGVYAEVVPIQWVYITSGIVYMICIYLMLKLKRLH
ncbi:MFS transporter [Macrococcoides goetzii]|uniref:MFS transporter n=1 Tax=Macrococcus TaxID=69965 RepID=UPI001EF18310|nr:MULTISPECIES: MFS transporter [Macrococcus]MCG7420524.1 MFS transporter [Macrococcus epidermidis]MCH4986240.1 MFS transporter [Macrococcus sp. PK]